MSKFNSFKYNLIQHYSGIAIRVVNATLRHVININNIQIKDKQQKLNDALMQKIFESDSDKNIVFKKIDEKKRNVFESLNNRGFSFSKITRKVPHIYPKVEKDEV